MRSSQRIKGVIVDRNSEGEESASRVRSRIILMFSIKSMDKRGLQLEFESYSDVRVSSRISLSFKVK